MNLENDDFMKMLIKCILFVAVMLVLAGCSSVMRPPSAVAFMDSYGQDKAVVNMSLALYGGDLDNDDTYYDGDVTDRSHSEWVFDGTGSVIWNKWIFSLGFGSQTVTPFTQLGIVSPYFGAFTWSSIYSPINIGNYMSENFWKDVSLGAMAVQQVPVGDNLKVGITEHFSRNGVEVYWSEIKEGFMAFSFPEPHPIFYREVGGGAFVSYKGESSTYALEFRYGRDLDNKCNRFAILFDFIGIADQKFIYDEDLEKKRQIKMREEEKKAEERRRAREQESLEEYEKRLNGEDE